MLEYVFFDQQVYERLWVVLSPYVVNSYREALEHVVLLLQVGELGNMRTLNHYFTLTLTKLRRKCIEMRLALAKS